MDLKTRLKKLEQQNAEGNSMARHSDCICFPEKEQPNFCSEEEKQTALRVQCPLHGRRFDERTPTIYKSAWLRESEALNGIQGHSEQYIKAMKATTKGGNW